MTTRSSNKDTTYGNFKSKKPKTVNMSEESTSTDPQEWESHTSSGSTVELEDSAST